jgi:hypothetical protein
MTHSDTAHKLVLGDRNDDYGSPGADFAGIAMMWSGLLNTKLRERITSVEVGLMMTALKLRRHAHKPKDDNLIDAHGYLSCVEWIEKGVRPLPLAEEEAADAMRVIESVCTGEKLDCAECGKPMPCMCGHKKHE